MQPLKDNNAAQTGSLTRAEARRVMHPVYGSSMLSACMQADAGELFIILRLLSASTGPELNSCEARQGTYMGQQSHRPAANEQPAGYIRYCSEPSQRLIRALALSTGA